MYGKQLSLFDQLSENDRLHINVTTLSQKIVNVIQGKTNNREFSWYSNQNYFTKPACNNYTSKHNEKVLERSSKLRSAGYIVKREIENKIKVNGEKYHVCIHGRPDIIAKKNGLTIIAEIKTGKPQPYHQYQVMLYMFLLRYDSDKKIYCQKNNRGNYIYPEGRIIYDDREIIISPKEINQNFINLLHRVLDEIIKSS
ncbi:MAG: PD-(D/E)XK nuclease family protein [Microcoleaceae cyanobacterium]